MATSYLIKNKNLLKGVKTYMKKRQDTSSIETGSIQQSDYLKDFMLKILNEGLAEAYAAYGDSLPGPSPPSAQVRQEADTPVSYDVIVVGAGMAGLSAAYEMKRAGLSVKILEQTERYGGRVFTYDTKNGLAVGLYGEGMYFIKNDVFYCIHA